MDYFQKYFNNFEFGLPTFIQNIVDKFSYVGLVSTPTENQFSEDDAEERFFLVIYNSSTTVSAAYATFIVLAISFALAAVFGALYYSLATSSSSSGTYRYYVITIFYTEILRRKMLICGFFPWVK